jgi:hypothetical protein
MSPQAHRMWEGWKRIAFRIGHFQSRLLLSLVYFILVGPFALPLRLFADSQHLRRRESTTHWLPREDRPATLDEARKL